MKLMSVPLNLSIAFAAFALTLPAQAQSSAQGRALFKQKNCALCHFYEARSIAPSVKKMKVGLKGDPAGTAAAISAAPGHATELGSTTAAEIRAISEWLAGTTFDEQAAAQAATPKPGSPEAKRLAAAKAREEAAARAKAATEAKAQAKREADARARKDPAALDAIKRENEARVKREAEAQAAAKATAEAKARKDADTQAAQKREADEKARADAEAKAKKDAEALAAKKPESAPAAKAEPAKTEPAAKLEASAPGAKKKIAYRDGSDLPPCPAPTGAPLGTLDEAAAKAIIERIGCQQCHAYVQKKTGPPMKRIQEKYKGDWECVTLRLTKNRTHKEEGVTDDLKPNEVKIVSDYVATRNK